MRRGPFALAVTLLAALPFGAAQADALRPPWVPRPPSPMNFAIRRPPMVRFVIEASDRTKETRLQIPRKLLPTLQTAALRGQRGDGVAARAGVAFWAVALTLGVGLACCGLRLIRPRRAFAGIGLTLVVAAVLLAGRGLASAHCQPPPIPNFAVTGQVVVEVVEQGDAIRLILDKSHTWPTRYER